MTPDILAEVVHFHSDDDADALTRMDRHVGDRQREGWYMTPVTQFGNDAEGLIGYFLWAREPEKLN